MTTRRAAVRWEGSLAIGEGSVVSSTSGVLVAARASWSARTGEPEDTSPEELIAAAHAFSFAMQLVHALETAGAGGTELEVSAEVSFEERDGAFTITRSALDVVGRVPGMDPDAFSRLAATAKDACPVSRALRGNVAISVHALPADEDVGMRAAGVVRGTKRMRCL